MANIKVDVTGDINSIKLDKNRYYLTIKNTDSPSVVKDAFIQIIKNTFACEFHTGDNEFNSWFGNTFEKLYKTKNSNVGLYYDWFGIKSSYKYREMKIGRLHLSDQRRGYRAVPGKLFNNDLIIDHDCKDFRFAINTEIDFPITKYLKYLLQQKKNKEARKVDSNVKKLQGTWSWAATMNDFYEHGYSNIGITASNYNPLEYIGTLTNGRRLSITMRKDSVEGDPLFDIWFMKGHLGRKLNKDGMVKFVESLIDMGVLSGTKNNSSNKTDDV